MRGLASRIENIEKRHLKENIEIASYINFLIKLKSFLSSNEILEIDNLISYLKKQIPLDKVERGTLGNYKEYFCLNCGEEILSFDDCCDKCGQRFTFRKSLMVIDSLPSDLFSEELKIE